MHSWCGEMTKTFFVVTVYLLPYRMKLLWTSSSSKCKLSIVGSWPWNASWTPSQNSWLLAAFPIWSLERDATFPSWEKPSANWSENRMLSSLKGHWGYFLVGEDSSTSEAFQWKFVLKNGLFRLLGWHSPLSRSLPLLRMALRRKVISPPFCNLIK